MLLIKYFILIFSICNYIYLINTQNNLIFEIALKQIYLQLSEKSIEKVISIELLALLSTIIKAKISRKNFNRKYKKL